VLYFFTFGSIMNLHRKEKVVKLPSISDLLKAGVYFGHKKEHLDPRAKDCVWAIRDRIAVIDVNKTLNSLEKALKFIEKEVKEGKIILLLGTKIQAKEKIKKMVEETGMPGIWQRWPGGLLTNFETVLKSLKKMEGLDAKIADPSFGKLARKEKLLLRDEAKRLHGMLDGLKNLKTRPDVLFIVDAHKERGAIVEAKKLKVAVVAICDTDADPKLCDFPIYANDDSFQSIDLILSLVSETILKNKKVKKEEKDDREGEKAS